MVDINLPDGFDIITANMFNDCEDLKEIIIPSSVKSIKTNAFQGCTSLEKITLSASIEVIAGIAFDGCNNLTICAPVGSYAEPYARDNEIAFQAI